MFHRTFLSRSHERSDFCLKTDGNRLLQGKKLILPSQLNAIVLN